MKKGSNVRILRKESYWHNEIGKVVTIDESNVRYGVLVRFEKVSYNGTNSANYNKEELVEVTN